MTITNLRQVQKTTDIPLSFGNDTAAIASTQTGVALYDRTHWGRLQITGADRIRFIHNQTTNNFNLLKPGQGCDTVFITSTARTIDLATVYLTDDAMIILVSPGKNEFLMKWLDRYIFPMDQIKLTDITPQTACFSLIGPASSQLITQLGGDPLLNQPDATHQIQSLHNIDVRVAIGSSLAIPGYTLIVPIDQAATLWEYLTQVGAVPLGETAWQHLRILQGRPWPDAELTEEYNPVEARLLHTISYEKGCYIGQETIARLNTYNAVKQQLYGVKLDNFVELGTPVMLSDEKIGKLTSCTQDDQGYFGLAYLKTKVGGVGLTIKIGEAIGLVVDLPFLQPRNS